MPSCPKCGNHTFEIQEIKVRAANFRTNVINCTSCGAIVGVQEFFNVSNLVYKLADRMNLKLDD